MTWETAFGFCWAAVYFLVLMCVLVGAFWEEVHRDR